MHNAYPVPQTMAGVDIDVDSQEYQAWYLSFAKILPAAIFEFQHNISEILNKHFEESTRANSQIAELILLCHRAMEGH
jgi:hypothetical protein